MFYKMLNVFGNFHICLEDRLGAREPVSKQKGDSCFLESELEFLNNLWGLGTELEQCCCTGPPG
jgi:hypothetical protein